MTSKDRIERSTSVSSGQNLLIENMVLKCASSHQLYSYGFDLHVDQLMGHNMHYLTPSPSLQPVIPPVPPSLLSPPPPSPPPLPHSLTPSLPPSLTPQRRPGVRDQRCGPADWGGPSGSGVARAGRTSAEETQALPRSTIHRGERLLIYSVSSKNCVSHLMFVTLSAVPAYL